MHIKEFAVERWMDRYENACRYNLAETCVESLTVAELLRLAGRPRSLAEELGPMKLTYGAIPGSDRLRALVATLYAQQAATNVLVTHGAIGANALVYQALVEPGDRVVTLLPAYQQHHAIPESLGADVRALRLEERTGFLPDLDELRTLVGGRARLIAFSNPNNPTGSLMNRATLEGIVGIAAEAGAWILADEVYRGIDQQGEGFTASIADLYDRGISTGSMSKVWSLAGLRLGWIVAPEDLLQQVTTHRDYNTISVGMLDDWFAATALEAKDAILSRNRSIVRTNLAVLDRWIAGEPGVSWVKPGGGTTALLRYAGSEPSERLCVRLVETTGVLFTPGSAFDIEGYVRIGYANNRSILEQSLSLVSTFLRPAD